MSVPSGKRQCAIQRSLSEQQNAAALSSAIDDATNGIMRCNAELMRQTSVNTARANQGAVIGMDTLTRLTSNPFYAYLVKRVDGVIPR